jgi:hypothetical protein
VPVTNHGGPTAEPTGPILAPDIASSQSSSGSPPLFSTESPRISSLQEREANFPEGAVPGEHSPTAPTAGDVAEAETARYLDGGTGPRPSDAMNCRFDGGVFDCGSCRTSSDCPSRHACTVNRATRRFECLPDECEEDNHCFPGSVCRVVSGSPPGPVVRRCLPTGPREMGDRCDANPAAPEHACKEGLLCIDQFCATPCSLNEPRSCPEGYSCGESLNGPGCVPDCRKLGCSSGQDCVRIFKSSYQKDTYQCMRLVVDECGDDKPCTDGKNCLTDGYKGRGGRFCASACQPWKVDSCSEGHVCGRGGPTGSSCYRKCNPQDLSTCPTGWLCKTVSEDLQSWGCRPDIHF